MKNLMYLILLCSIISCSKDAETTKEKKYAIKEVFLNGNIYTQYEYDTKNRMSSIVQYKDDDQIHNSKIFYNKDTITYLKIMSSPYSVSSDTIKYYNFSENEVYKLSCIYEGHEILTKYQLEDCGISFEHTKWLSSSYSDASEYTTKYDSECNYKVYNTQGELIKNVLVDDKKSFIHSSHAVFKHFNIKQGNIIEYNIIGDDTDYVNRHSYTATLEYNEDDYPTKQVRTYKNGVIETYEYKYLTYFE